MEKWWRGLLLVWLASTGACGNTARPRDHGAEPSAGLGGEASAEGGGGAGAGGGFGVGAGGTFIAAAGSGAAGAAAGTAGAAPQPPGCRLCFEGDVYACDEDGERLGLEQDCTAYAHCAETGPNDAACLSNECQPGTVRCFDNVRKTCSDDGAFPAVGVDCGEQLCFVGECIDPVCSPAVEYFCWEGDVYTCLGGGVQRFLSYECPGGTRCVDIEGVDCVQLPCTAGEPACLGNALGTCADDGAQLASVSQDCAASGQICDVAATCVEIAVDAASASDELHPWEIEYTFGNVVDVHADRLLTRLEAPIAVGQGVELRWVVYEWDGTVYQLRATDSGQTSTADGMVSSGPLSQPLRAGQRYLLALYAPAGGISIRFAQSAMQRWSFGVLAGGAARTGDYAQSGDAFLPLAAAMAQRVTTVPLVE